MVPEGTFSFFSGSGLRKGRFLGGNGLGGVCSSIYWCC